MVKQSKKLSEILDVFLCFLMYMHKHNLSITRSKSLCCIELVFIPDFHAECGIQYVYPSLDIDTKYLLINAHIQFEIWFWWCCRHLFQLKRLDIIEVYFWISECSSVESALWSMVKDRSEVIIMNDFLGWTSIVIPTCWIVLGTNLIQCAENNPWC